MATKEKNELVGTTENPDILDYLDSGLDNADGEYGGILLTMKEAAIEIRKLRKQIKEQ